MNLYNLSFSTVSQQQPVSAPRMRGVPQPGAGVLRRGRRVLCCVRCRTPAPHHPPRCAAPLRAQDAPVFEYHVSVILWSNMSLAVVADQWPKQGYTFNRGVSFVGMPPGQVGRGGPGPSRDGGPGSVSQASMPVALQLALWVR